ncbi:MAG: hypothetical protein AB7G39_11410 [Alphaproteobacteria bacterium]
MDPVAFYRAAPPYAAKPLKALPEDEKYAAIPIMLEDGRFLPAETQRIRPYACTPDQAAHTPAYAGGGSCRRRGGSWGGGSAGGSSIGAPGPSPGGGTGTRSGSSSGGRSGGSGAAGGSDGCRESRLLAIA